VGDLVENRVGTDEGKMVIDPFAHGDVPFQEADQGATTAQVQQLVPRGRCASDLW
jgi:hypothetical protein